MYLKYFSDKFSKLFHFLGHLKRLNIVCTTESSYYLLSWGMRGLICDQRHNLGKEAKRAACFFLTVAVPHVWFMAIISA